MKSVVDLVAIQIEPCSAHRGTGNIVVCVCRRRPSEAAIDIVSDTTSDVSSDIAPEVAFEVGFEVRSDIAYDTAGHSVGHNESELFVRRWVRHCG